MNANDRPVEPSRPDGRFSRRGFLAGAAAVSAGAMVGGRQAGVAHAQEAGSGLHGAQLRGMFLTSKNRLAEGRFGLMFKRLPAYAPSDDLLTGLASKMVEPPPPPPDTFDPFAATSPRLFAGFTFIGQFIDHDITFDHTPLDQQLADPDATVNFRTPRYDLDSVYGQGPASESKYYDPADPVKLLVVAGNANGVEDMARDGAGKAIIPDPRNDENLIIVQLHKAVAKFHNQVVDYLRAQGLRPEWVFETARRLTRWHYQWAVIHDFLPRFVGDGLVPNGAVYKEVAGKPPVINLNYYKPTNREGRPFMPVEFAVAAYRFGHSLIRPFYVLNDTGVVDVFGPEGGRNLNGGRPIPSDLVIVWRNILPDLGPPGGRKPRKIDTKLSIPLTNLPGSAVPPPPPEPIRHLAVRNNLRGKHVGLPSGQQVARAMRANVLSNTTLGLTESGWGGEAPLWFYILKEAELVHDGEQLGPVGGRIMAETLVGLLQRDPNSYLYLDAAWKPAPPIASTIGQFTFADLLKYARATGDP
jgi:Animal haem peroxidase